MDMVKHIIGSSSNGFSFPYLTLKVYNAGKKKKKQHQMSRFGCEVINTLTWIIDITFSESVSTLGNTLNLVISHLTSLLRTESLHWEEEGEEWSQKLQ